MTSQTSLFHSFYGLAIQPGKVGDLVPEENATTKRGCASVRPGIGRGDVDGTRQMVDLLWAFLGGKLKLHLDGQILHGNYERYERRKNGNIEIHDPYLLSRSDLSFKVSQSRKVHRSIVGRCRFEALGWLWQDQVVLRFYLLRGGWWWCNRWQHVKHRFWCAQNPGGLHRDVFVSSLGTHFERSFPLNNIQYTYAIYTGHMTYMTYTFLWLVLHLQNVRRWCFSSSKLNSWSQATERAASERQKAVVLQQLLLSVLRPWVKGDQSRVHVYFSLQIWFPGVFQSNMSIRNATPACLRLSDRERPESLIERPLEAGSCWYGPKVAMAAMGTVEDLDSLEFDLGVFPWILYHVYPKIWLAIDCHGWHPSFEWHGTLTKYCSGIWD